MQNVSLSVSGTFNIVVPAGLTDQQALDEARKILAQIIQGEESINDYYARLTLTENEAAEVTSGGYLPKNKER